VQHAISAFSNIAPALAASISDQITGWYAGLGPWLFYAVVWGLVFAGTGLLVGAFVPFVTGDSLVFAAGLVAATSGDVNIWFMAIGVGIAAWLGDQVGYALGRHYGRPYLDRRKGKWLHAAIAKSDAIYAAWGWWAVVIARFMPWARVFVPVIAGISRMNYYKFFSANAVGALAWGTGLTVTGYFAATIPAVKNVSYGIAIFFILASAIAGLRAWLKNRSN
jgi:membrane-associated protein